MPSNISFIRNAFNKAGFKKSAIVWFYIKFAFFVTQKEI